MITDREARWYGRHVKTVSPILQSYEKLGEGIDCEGRINVNKK